MSSLASKSPVQVDRVTSWFCEDSLPLLSATSLQQGETPPQHELTDPHHIQRFRPQHRPRPRRCQPGERWVNTGSPAATETVSLCAAFKAPQEAVPGPHLSGARGPRAAAPAPPPLLQAAALPGSLTCRCEARPTETRPVPVLHAHPDEGNSGVPSPQMQPRPAPARPGALTPTREQGRAPGLPLLGTGAPVLPPPSLSETLHTTLRTSFIFLYFF